MNRAAVPIPEKLFFKIGEVCDITGVQAHVLRYWESEFPMLAPQKNRAGQRTYRKRDVEMALRIKELLYEDQYTIAGARKRLANELRGASKLKVVTPEMSTQQPSTPSSPQLVSTQQTQQQAEEPPPVNVEAHEESEPSSYAPDPKAHITGENRVALRRLREQLHDILVLLEANDPPASAHRR